MYNIVLDVNAMQRTEASKQAGDFLKFKIIQTDV